MKVLLGEVNISEGSNLQTLDACKAAVLSVEGVELIDFNADADHNRTVFTFKGEAYDVLEAAKRLAQKAIELIDMTTHTGSHPRMGAVDVAPFIPVKGIEVAEAVEIAKQFGAYVGSLGMPVFYYEEAATCEARKSLVAIRKGQYEALAEKMTKPEWKPDEGPHAFVPKSGAMVTGVRFPLVAFNINFRTEDIDAVKKIVAMVRGAAGGYQHVRAIALPLEDKKMVQLSMNLTNYEKTPIHRVFETIKSEANALNLIIDSSELVGPVPIYAFEDLLKFYIKLDGFSMEQVYS